MMKNKAHLLFLLGLLWLMGLACGRATSSASYSSGNYHETITVDERDRAYILHVPPQVDTASTLPLLIVLHGSYGSGRKMQVGLGFDSYADERGFLVVYPDAYADMRWNDGRGTLASSAEGVDDVAFILAMIDAIADKVALDRERIFVTGASNGGMMAYRLGCETEGVLAGIAPVIGNVPEPIAAACQPAAPIDFLSINGDSDPYIPLDGGDVCARVERGCEKGQVISTVASWELFAAANGCSLTPTAETLPALVDDGTTIERTTYSDCQNGAQVMAYVVQGGGHAWPPRSPQLPGGGDPTGNINATQTIVDFFFPE